MQKDKAPVDRMKTSWLISIGKFRNNVEVI